MPSRKTFKYLNQISQIPKKKYEKYILAGILLHIITSKTTYSYESHHYGKCNQTLTSTSPISRKVKPATQNYKVPIKRVKILILDS